jgi:hypothetical protein
MWSCSTGIFPTGLQEMAGIGRLEDIVGPALFEKQSQSTSDLRVGICKQYSHASTVPRQGARDQRQPAGL